MGSGQARARARRSRNPNSLKNLNQGAPLGGAYLTVDASGVAQTTFLIAEVYHEFSKGIHFSHVRNIQTLYGIAEDNFRDNIRRPTSSGDRPGDRMTGRFTFGAGGAFQGTVINEPTRNQYGIGFPKISEADRRTRFVWRSLEYGLGPKGSGGDFGPQGDHILPSRFHFDTPGDDRSGKLILGKDPKDRFRRKQNRRTRVSRRNAERLGQGFEGKFFIERSMTEIADRMPRDYRRVWVQTFESM